MSVLLVIGTLTIMPRPSVVKGDPEAEAMADPLADPMMTSSFNSRSNSIYAYRTLPPPTMMQIDTDGSYSSMGPSYTTARPMFLPEKATTLQSPIYYPESPALPQYYPGPLSSGSDR